MREIMQARVAAGVRMRFDPHNNQNQNEKWTYFNSVYGHSGD